MKIAVIECKCEIDRVIASTMLRGNDVVDVERRLVVCLMNEAMLAPISRSLSDKTSSRGVHHAFEGWADRARRAFTLRMLMRLIPST